MRAALALPRAARVTALVWALSALGGCWSQVSDVPAIEADDRPRRTLLADGVYCPVLGHDGAVELENDCTRFEWDRGSRRIHATQVFRGDGDGDDIFWLEAVRVPRGLTLLQQYETPQSGYDLFALVTGREGYVIVPLAEPAVQYAIAAEEDVVLDPEAFEDDYGGIAGGSPAAVRRLVSGLAAAWFAEAPSAEQDKLAPHDPDAGGEVVGPVYTVRLESLDAGLDEAAAVEKSVAQLRRALERAARR